MTVKQRKIGTYTAKDGTRYDIWRADIDSGETRRRNPPKLRGKAIVKAAKAARRQP